MRHQRDLAAYDESSSDPEQPCCGSGLQTPTPRTRVQELSGEVVEVEIPKSTHGAALLAIAQACDQTYIDEHGSHQAFGRLANGLLLFILGGGIQIELRLHSLSVHQVEVLVGLLFLFSEERMQDPYEEIGTKQLAEDLRGALAAHEALSKTHEAVQLCQNDHSVPWSQSMVTFVWLCKCVPSIVSATWATYVVACLSSSSGATVSSKTGKLSIVALPLVPKMLTVMFVQVPLVVLNILLAITGMKFLMYCNALGKLIVKAMSLSYIETVAGVVFAGLSSKTFQMEVNKSFVVHEFKRLHVLKLDSWLSGLLKIVSIASLTLWYCRIKHYNLQEFRLACFQYKYEFVFPNCGVCGLDFFGLHLAN